MIYDINIIYFQKNHLKISIYILDILLIGCRYCDKLGNLKPLKFGKNGA